MRTKREAEHELNVAELHTIEYKQAAALREIALVLYDIRDLLEKKTI